jgi:uncharacterized protein YgiM (DUF1202 family)
MKRFRSLSFFMILSFSLIVGMFAFNPSKSEAATMFIKPAEGSISSPYGNRSGGMHHGIDIAKSGTVQVKASAAGTVSKSYYSSSYGEVIFVKHNINGQTYETVYAHLRSGSRAVSVGESVTQGQFIGYMGATGDANGQHTHFELHKGLWNNDKSNSVDPVPYFSKTVNQILWRYARTDLHLRVDANWDSAVGDTVPYGYAAQINYGVTKNGFVQVIFRGKKYWHKESLTHYWYASDPATIYVVTANKVNFRVEPDWDSAVGGVREKGDEVRVMGMASNGWLKLVMNDRIVYIPNSTKYVKVK